MDKCLWQQNVRTPYVKPLRSCKISKSYYSSRRRSNKCRAGADDRDLVTKIFGGLFGQKALEDRKPFGMQRMSDEDMYELYPATTTKFAAPVDSDDSNMKLFRPLLAQTRLEKTSLRLAYDANKDGWTSEEFHAKLNGYGAAVVLAETVDGDIAGGYNPQGWIGLSEDRDSNAAFLFGWPTKNTGEQAIKLPKVGGPNLAILDGSENGIQFGAEGLIIAFQYGKEKLARSKLGSYYAKLPNGTKSLFANSDLGKGRATLKDLKVYVADGEPEQWQLDGIMWKSQDGTG